MVILTEELGEVTTTLKGGISEGIGSQWSRPYDSMTKVSKGWKVERLVQNRLNSDAGIIAWILVSVVRWIFPGAPSVGFDPGKGRKILIPTV